jgi:uncharacterized membrane protein YGL010W
MPTPFRPALTLLTQYAAYHRDRRNIATHLVGVPMIVFAVVVLLSRPVFAEPGGMPLTPAFIATLAAVAYYTALDRPIGLLMAVVLAAMLAGAAPIAAAGTASWLGWGLGLFVVGWIIQFIGHVFEGRKPAFVDDVMGLLVGPIFVAAEILFLLGARRTLQAEIERRVGPTRSGARGDATA